MLQAEQHYSDAVWIPTLATLGQGIFMPLSGYLEDRVGVRITILIGKTSVPDPKFLITNPNLDPQIEIRIFISGSWFRILL